MVASSPAEPKGSMLDTCHRVSIPADPFPPTKHDLRQSKGRPRQTKMSKMQVGPEPTNLSLLTLFPFSFVAQLQEENGKWSLLAQVFHFW